MYALGWWFILVGFFAVGIMLQGWAKGNVTSAHVTDRPRVCSLMLKGDKYIGVD